jgi:hypothetical protein
MASSRVVDLDTRQTSFDVAAHFISAQRTAASASLYVSCWRAQRVKNNSAIVHDCPAYETLDQCKASLVDNNATHERALERSRSTPTYPDGPSDSALKR